MRRSAGLEDIAGQFLALTGYHFLGESAEAGRIDRLLHHSGMALLFEPQYAALWLALDAKNYTQALQVADQLPPDNPDQQTLRAIALIKLGKFTEANTALNRALELNPQSVDALYVQGILQELYVNQPQTALDAYLKYIALVPNDRGVQRWINVVQKQLKLPLTRFNAPAVAAPSVDPETPSIDQTPQVVAEPSPAAS